MAAITCISPDDARTLSVSLFRAMETLVHAEAHLHSVHSEKEDGKTEAKITTTLFRASQVAHSSCESALAHIEPFYDTHTESTVADDSASCSCRSLVSSALENADTVFMALEHASKHCEITTLPMSMFCGDEAMRAAMMRVIWVQFLWRLCSCWSFRFLLLLLFINSCTMPCLCAIKVVQ